MLTYAGAEVVFAAAKHRNLLFEKKRWGVSSGVLTALTHAHAFHARWQIVGDLRVCQRSATTWVRESIVNRRSSTHPTTGGLAMFDSSRNRLYALRSLDASPVSLPESKEIGGIHNRFRPPTWRHNNY